MKSHRLARVAEVVREVVANAVLFEIKDPRVKKNVTVIRAEVSGDLQHAKVFVSVMGSEKAQQLTMHGLKSAAGFVQTRLADRLTTRFVPHVTFVLDDGIKKSIEIARLIREAKGEPEPSLVTEDDDESDIDAADGVESADSADKETGTPGAADGSDGRRPA